MYDQYKMQLFYNIGNDIKHWDVLEGYRTGSKVTWNYLEELQHCLSKGIASLSDSFEEMTSIILDR